MNTFPMILNGSKFSWHNGPSACDGIGHVDDHPGFPKSGRAPKQVAVRSHKTGWIMVFDFVEIADDGEGSVAINYQGNLPDGRYCSLAFVAD